MLDTKQRTFKTSIALTQEDQRILEELQKQWGESTSGVIRRCLQLTHQTVKFGKGI